MHKIIGLFHCRKGARIWVSFSGTGRRKVDPSQTHVLVCIADIFVFIWRHFWQSSFKSDPAFFKYYYCVRFGPLFFVMILVMFIFNIVASWICDFARRSSCL